MTHPTLSDILRIVLEEAHKTGKPHTVMYMHTCKYWGWAPRSELFNDDGSPTDFLKQHASVYFTIYP